MYKFLNLDNAAKLNIIYFVVFTFAIIILPFSPFFSYILFLLNLLLFSYKINKIFLVISFILSVFSQFYILHSRAYVVELEFDLTNYYFAYLDLSSLSISQVSNNSIEIGWFIIYKIIALINKNLSIFDLAVINNLICVSIFLIWLLKYGVRNIGPEYLGFVLGLIVLFMWPNNFAFFQRQSISVAILLFAISNIKNQKYFLFFLILSSFFHITSLIMGLVYYVIVNYNFNHFVLKTILILGVVRISFETLLIYLFSVVEIPDLSRKISFYAENHNGFFLAFSEIRYFPLFVFIFLFYNNIESEWRRIIIFSALFYLSLLGIQFASGRFNFILIYLYGYFLWIVTKSRPYILLIFALSYFIFDVIYKSGYIFYINDTFWQRYPFFSSTPFYYLSF
ncbi:MULTISPECIES: EpsG family protein [unclassified Acinetobacter]|uniref:EpsG family protein n=1 Tax=unclassified Acinetobacter TaxID=196816 RepID=UPI002881238B|nr:MULTISPECIES: EpsG family protein [unclassified Acinetobacter]MDT0198987.1 EpsG family protein [Acinetobacter sp. RG5]MDT0230629.1 EpsG family protein [Acinetobacter sp. RRD8]